jgi:UDPglucose--hexose-1-phosphate uridylyltransferase
VSQLRLDPLTGRWVTIAAERATRPADFTPRRLPVETGPQRPCPFCPGHEEDTPPALETYGRDGTWLVRVVPNLYPAFSGSHDLEITRIGPIFEQAPANGIHEVLVLTPRHDVGWAELGDKEVGLVMAAIRDRLEDHAHHSSVAYTQMIVNHGREAGASLEHPHGQLLGIPFVPGELSDELDGFARFAAASALEVAEAGDPTGPVTPGGPEGCLLCRLVEIERHDDHRVVLDTGRVLVVCPFWSGSPYELLVVPVGHERHLAQASPTDLVATGRALRDALARVRELIGDVAYNIVFHTAPHHDQGAFHWHVHVVPRITSVAGFEQGTGVRINIVAPETAAAELRTP